MFRFLLNTLFNTAAWYLFLDWSWRQAETQIDSMQEAVFNSPGVEPPVPPAVVTVGATVLTGHMLLSRLLRLRGWQSLLSLTLGSAAGTALLSVRGRN